MPPAELATSLATTEADRLMQAEAEVRDYCGWHIGPSRVDDELTVEARGGTVLDLPSLYVTAVTSVTEDGVLLEETAYRWRQHGVIERLGSCWGFGRVEVVLTHGYTPIPANVTGVVQALAQRALDNPKSRVRVQVGQVSNTYSQAGFNQSVPLALADAEKLVLDKYRIRYP